jgi:ABC-type transporter Mla subunit MlaD
MATEGYHDAAGVRARWLVGAGLVLVAAALSVLAIALPLRRSTHSVRISACFQDVHGLRSAAPVRIAGVDVGLVKSIRGQPTNSTCPANVEMELRTDYPLAIPIDAVASVSTSGILGPTYVAIDATHTSGATVANGGQIGSRESTPPADLSLEGVDRVLKAADKALEREVEQKRTARPSGPADAKTPSQKTHP